MTHVKPATGSVLATLAEFMGMLLAVYLGVFTLAFVCYMLVEKPFMNLR